MYINVCGQADLFEHAAIIIIIYISWSKFYYTNNWTIYWLTKDREKGEKSWEQMCLNILIIFGGKRRTDDDASLDMYLTFFKTVPAAGQGDLSQLQASRQLWLRIARQIYVEFKWLLRSWVADNKAPCKACTMFTYTGENKHTAVGAADLPGRNVPD